MEKQKKNINTNTEPLKISGGGLGNNENRFYRLDGVENNNIAVTYYAAHRSTRK